MLLSLTHMCFPRARRHARKFFELSYYNPDSGAYRAGWNDAWMVFFWIVVFTGLRAAVMEYILTPLAKKGGVKTERDQTRFAEQAWLWIYATSAWSLGLVCCSNFMNIHILTASVYPLELRLHVGFQGIVDKLAKSRDGWTTKVVHSCSICFLAPAGACHPPRGKEKRPLADVGPPHCYNSIDFHELWLSSNQGGQPHSLHYGLCRSCLPSKLYICL